MDHRSKKDPFVVMLVDDQTIIAEAVRRLLNAQGDFELHYCSEGARALETAAELKPLVILQDLVMPDADGMELLRAYRRHPALKNTPVIILSVKEDPVVKKEAFEAGAYDYMVKLPDAHEFVARVRHHAQACLDERLLSEAMRALRESQQQTQERNIQLEKINEQKNRVLGVAAHDLRNPLGNIYSLSEFLQEETAQLLSEDQMEMLTCIRELSEFTLKMVEDLLDVSTIESGELRLDRRPLDFSVLVHHNVELNAILAQKKNITLNLEPIPPLPPVSLDAEKIAQVFNNLIGNAVKYSHSDTTVRIVTSREQDRVKISVIDQGQGISDADIPKLFKPFGRANVETTGGERSTGLGLAITRRIVEGHGGTIGVESEPDIGSTFFFTLPINSSTTA